MACGMTTRLLMWLLVVPCLFQVRADAYSAGEGTVVSPYVLSCREDIMELASRPEDFDKSFILATDIDMGGEVFDHSIVSPDIVFVPSFSAYRGFFTGCFNGNGHVISNFSIRGNGCHGFFGGVGWDGEVMHLGLEDAFVDGQDTGSVGMLAGVSMGLLWVVIAKGTWLDMAVLEGLSAISTTDASLTASAKDMLKLPRRASEAS